MHGGWDNKMLLNVALDGAYTNTVILLVVVAMLQLFFIINRFSKTGTNGRPGKVYP